VFMRHLVLVILCGWLSGMHPSNKCRIETVVSPDDGPIVPRNMYRLINTLRINIPRINCATSWLYLQCGNVVSPTHWPSLPTRDYSWYSFLLEAESTTGP
jgi:hypothetical protein